ncbi:SusC/RagA family TonB-linked outer membrane protein [Membranihabitans maritimus]|uniref:SusC/RagA family TonB-linked outer membrane protein n=1 Tax=Membranihabitans maritimus TaxID=2904244 RepID=UPI001F361323|nr:TonB-dependent receptor [Membranihabitans maritimus]
MKRLQTYSTQKYLYVLAFLCTFLISTEAGLPLLSDYSINNYVPVNPFPVSGTVVDSEGEPLIGVNIQIKGKSTGTATDFDGQFTIEGVNSGDVLIISYVGYVTQEVPIESESSELTITLENNSEMLDEVVVVGYGSQVKREVTGSVQSLDAEEFKDLPVSQVSQKLQGRLSGVQINQTTGKPGQGMSVRIRGQLSVSGGSDPLYVIDGFPITGDINNLNPDEIEDISVLKDAASTSLYGSRAANGVVLITTKKGKPGQTNVSFNTYVGMQTVPEYNRLEMMNAVEFAQFKKEYYEDQGDPVPAAFQNPSDYEGKTNDWYDAVLRDAPMQSYNLTITSNKDDSRTSLVAGVFDQQGVVINSEYNRYSLRMNADYDVSDQVRIGFNLAPQYVFDNTPRTDGERGTGILFNALHTWPIMPIYDENGELTKFNRFPAETGNIFAYPNWVRASEEITNETKEINLLSNAFIEYSPFKNLTLKSTFNAQLENSKFFFFNPSTATNQINVAIPTTASSNRSNYQEFGWLNENYATYNQSFGDHNFELLGGFTIQKLRREFSRISTNTYADDRIPSIQGGINIDRGGTFSAVDEWSLASLLSRLTYNYQGKYLLTASIRGDGSSRFGADNRWGIFPSASLGWVFSDEGFMDAIPAISFAKARASYGITGNNNIGNYTQYALINNTVNVAFGDNIAPGAAVTSLANSNLGWETTKQFDIGLDVGILNDRFQFIYDYYVKNTTNLLYSVQVAQESGFTNFNDNIGEIKFWGHEFAVVSRNLTGELSWTTNANISFNRNKVLSLAEGIDRVYGRFHITQVGQPFGQFYGHVADGVYLNQEDLDSSPQVPGRSTVGSIKLLDLNNDGIITNGGDDDDRTIIGNPFPKFVYGLVNNLRYKDWDLSITTSGSHGNQLLMRHLYSTANLDGVFNLVKRVEDRFRSEEDPGDGFFGTTVGGGNVTGIERDWMNSRFVADASYFSIRNITLGYTLNKENRVFRSLRLYASIQNAYTFTSYWGGSNPETSVQPDGEGDGGNLSQGVDIVSYPVPVITTIGANFNF